MTTTVTKNKDKGVIIMYINNANFSPDTLINNVPFGHTNDLDSGIDDLITVIRENDVFYKTA